MCPSQPGLCKDGMQTSKAPPTGQAPDLPPLHLHRTQNLWQFWKTRKQIWRICIKYISMEKLKPSTKMIQFRSLNPSTSWPKIFWWVKSSKLTIFFKQLLKYLEEQIIHTKEEILKDVFFMGIFIGIMMAEMSILCPFLGEIISGDHGKLPHCPPVWSDPAPASSKSPSSPSSPPCRRILPPEEGKETSGSQSFRVTCPLKCHGAHQPALQRI